MLATLAAASAFSAGTWFYASASGPLNNPLKGWTPFIYPGSIINQPYSTAYFNVTWRELEPTKGTYAFDAWERAQWELPGAKGKNIVYRLILDYPGSPTGVPQWLIDEGLQMTPYTDHGGGLSPDYTNPKLQEGLKKLLKAMGARYNNNPRVSFVQAGSLGFWGEWHTWPREELMAPEAFQKEVLDTILASYPNKKVMARNPATVAGQYPNLGFHDDMIPEDTMGPDDWMFVPSLIRQGRQDNWKSQVFGGEMVPGKNEQYTTTDFNKLKEAVEGAHFSWIGPNCSALNDIQTALYLANSREIVRRMGYQFHLKSATATLNGSKLNLKFEGQNEGVAPFYYQWPVDVALLNAKGKPEWTARTNIDVRTWLPGSFAGEVNVEFAKAAGPYKLAIGVIDPYRKVPNVEFATSLTKIDGWQVLGEVAFPIRRVKTSND